MSFSIDKVYYISLDYRLDKHVAFESACALCEIPYHLIERFPACYGNDCEPTDLDEILYLMAEDGFPEWRDFYFMDEGGTKIDPVLASVTWSKMALLRRVADSGKNVIVSSDTCFSYGFLYENLLLCVDHVSQDYDVFKGLFLGCYASGEPFVDVAHEVFPSIKSTFIPGIYFLPHCFLPFALVLTPEGAAEILGVLRNSSWNIFNEALYFANFYRYEGYFCSIPAKVKFLGHTDYPFSRSDKIGWATGVRDPSRIFNFPPLE